MNLAHEYIKNYREYTSYEDLKANCRLQAPEDFNFAYDIVDRYARETPDKRALVWIDDNSEFWRIYQNSTPTWSSYQRLIEKALGERKKRVLQGDKDFEFDAFTTELNNEAKPSSRVKGKEEREKLTERIEVRLKLFKHSDFIKSFPVIILACGGYIRNDDKVREIDDTFHVTFSKRYDYSTGNWFCTHYDDMDPKRLVIHTRQLSNGVSYKMIDEMASVIREHLDHLKKLGKI